MQDEVGIQSADLLYMMTEKDTESKTKHWT